MSTSLPPTAVVSSTLVLTASLGFYYYYKNMTSLAAIKTANATALTPKSYLPVAIFLGGTSGIGQGLAEAFARHTKGNAHIIVVGRNQAAADAIIAKFPKPTSQDASHVFVKCDVASMTSVRAATSDILAKYSKINYIAMSPGYMTMKGFDETEDGIDRKLAVHYYGRWLFATRLVGALEKAKGDGEEGRLLSVLAAGKGAEVDFNDLGLKKTFSVTKAGLQAPSYNDLMVDELASRYPTLAFTHSFPGLVRTNIASSSDSFVVRTFLPITFGLLYPFSISQADCGEYQLHGMLNSKTGANRVGQNGQDIGKTRYYGSEEGQRRLWEHTAEVTAER